MTSQQSPSHQVRTPCKSGTNRGLGGGNRRACECLPPVSAPAPAPASTCRWSAFEERGPRRGVVPVWVCLMWPQDACFIWGPLRRIAEEDRTSCREARFAGGPRPAVFTWVSPSVWHPPGFFSPWCCGNSANVPFFIKLAFHSLTFLFYCHALGIGALACAVLGGLPYSLGLKTVRSSSAVPAQPWNPPWGL